MAADKKTHFLLKTKVNSFHYLYQDAEYLMSAACLPNIKGTFEEVRITRSAMLLYIFSLEGLINRALDNFLQQPIHDFIIDREEKFSTAEKWQLLPLLAAIPPSKIEMGSYPWSHFVELLKVRNDYVHPKHDRMAYYEAVSQTNLKHLEPKDIPEGSRLKEKDLLYGQTKLPKDPYGFRLPQLEIVKKIVDDTVQELDKVLAGRILEDDWARNDQMTLFFPEGAKFDDIPKP